MKTQEKQLKNTPIRRIKYLMLLQMGERLRLRKNQSGKKRAFLTFLKVCVCIAVFAAAYFALGYFRDSFQIKLSKPLLISILFLTQVVGVISAIGSILSILYTSKENTMLLAFPCKYGEIFISKLAVFAVEEIKKSCFFILPFLIAYGALVGGASYWIFLLPVWLMLCLFPVLIGAIISIPCIYIKRFLEKHMFLYALLIGTVLVFVFVLLTVLLSKLPTPVRLVAIYGKFIVAVEEFLASLSSLAVWYIFLGNLLFGESLLWCIPLALAVFAGFSALCFFVAKPFYFKAVSSTVEAGGNKRHKPKHHKHNNIFLTFLRKEFKLFVRNSQSLNSAVLTILTFPLLSYVFNFILAAINTNVLGDFLSVAFNVMITLSILSTHNANSASALSSEGSEFAVLKTAPSNTMIIAWAKIAVAEVVNIIALVTTFIMLTITTELSLLNLGLMTLVLFLMTTAHIFWSFQIDVCNPKILDYAMKGGDSVVNNSNVAKAVVIGFFTATIAGVLTLLLLMDSFTSGWIRIILLAAAFLIIRWYLFRRNLKVYFNDIQF